LLADCPLVSQNDTDGGGTGGGGGGGGGGDEEGGGGGGGVEEIVFPQPAVAGLLEAGGAFLTRFASQADSQVTNDDGDDYED